MANFKIASEVVLGNDNFIQNFPTGATVPYFGTTVPDGWLLCNGASYSATGTYKDLYDVIGITYGGVLGTSFLVPSLNNKYPSSSNNDNSNTTYPQNHQHNANSAIISTDSHSLTHNHNSNVWTPAAASASHNHNTPLGTSTNGGVTPGSNANSVANRAVNSGPAANSPQAGWVGHTHNAGSGAINLSNDAFNHNHNVLGGRSMGFVNTAASAPAHNIASFNISHTAGGVTPLALKALYLIKY